MNVNIILNLPCSEYRDVICAFKKRPVLTAENLQLFSSGRSNCELTNGRNISMFCIPKLIKACIYICIRIIKNANLTFVDIYSPNLRFTTCEYILYIYIVDQYAAFTDIDTRCQRRSMFENNFPQTPKMEY